MAQLDDEETAPVLPALRHSRLLGSASCSAGSLGVKHTTWIERPPPLLAALLQAPDQSPEVRSPRPPGAQLCALVSATS